MAREAKAVQVKTAMHIDSDSPTPVPNELPVLSNAKPPRGLRNTEVITTHYFPGLLPFGTVQLRVMRNDRWWIKCGSIRMSGWGGDVDDIVKAFVKKVKSEVEEIATEVSNESFTTEPKSF